MFVEVCMAWFWTDDLARLVADHGIVVTPIVANRLDEASRRPVAVARPVESDPMRLAEELFGLTPPEMTSSIDRSVAAGAA